MNSRKEVLVASILAISLAVGLGTISYALFSPTPTTARLQSALDIFTQKSGHRVNVSGGNFEPFENVSIYALLTQAGFGLENYPLTFTVYTPDGRRNLRTVLTNSSGIAESNLCLLPSEGLVTGTWHVIANATVDNEAISDTLYFQCQSQEARIDVFSEKNGVPSISFLPSDTVLVEAQLSYGNVSIAGTPVTFDIRTPNGTGFLVQTTYTNSLGIASIAFQIPEFSDSCSGIWRIFATSEVDGQSLHGTASFGCFLLSPVIDVFTQKGGVGPNTNGGYFTLDESVFLYAEVWDQFNQTVPNQLVAFAVIDPNGTRLDYRVQMTNASGIASITTRIPPDVAYIGTFEVYATTGYQEQLVLFDTLTFVAKQN
jgi:uncharacterized protein YfaS (alpha-2-macroglobulin family)